MRVRVYIDGFNVYYRGLRGTPYKWLDPLKLSRSLLRDEDDVHKIRYFTARVSSRANNSDAPKRQQAYISALSTLPQISLHYGRFLARTKTRPLVSSPNTYVEVHDTEEKGSDVNIAAFLIRDAWKDLYDTALVFSQDSDLCEAIRIVKNEMEKAVGLVWFDNKEPGRRMRACCSFVRHATSKRLAAAQFPDELMGKSGHLIRRPEAW